MYMYVSITEKSQKVKIEANFNDSPTTYSHFGAVPLEDDHPPSLVASGQKLSIMIELHR